MLWCSIKNTVNVNHVFPQLTLDFAAFIVIDVTSNKEQTKKQEQSQVCVFPPNAVASLENIDKVCKILTSCVNVSFPTFVLCDFNLPYIDWSVPISHGGVNHQAFVQFCMNNSLNQLIAEPTHSNGNILDLLLCNYFSSSILISYCIDMPFCSSCDHSSIHFHLKWTVKTNTTKPKCHNFQKANYKVICEMLSCINWNSVLESSGDCVQTLYDHILEILSQTI